VDGKVIIQTFTIINKCQIFGIKHHSCSMFTNNLELAAELVLLSPPLKAPSPEGSIWGCPVRPTPIFSAYSSKNATKLAMV
jgi:hypothetical protein